MCQDLEVEEDYNIQYDLRRMFALKFRSMDFLPRE